MATLAELMEQVALPQPTVPRPRGAYSPEYLAYLDELRRERLAREAEAERTRSRTAGEVARDAAIQLLGKGSVGLGQALYGVGNMVSLGALDRVTGMSENFDRTHEILNSWLSAPTQREQAAVQAAFDRGFLPGMRAAVTSAPFMQDLLVGNVAQILPSAAAGSRVAGVMRAAGAKADDIARAAGTASIRMGGSQAAGSTNVEAINAIREAGGDETLQQLGGLGAGAVVGVATPAISRLVGTDRLYGQVLARLSGTPTTVTGGVARNTATGLLRQGAEESLQSGVEQVAQNVPTPGVSIFEGVPQAMGLGSLAGGVLGGGMGAVSGTSVRSSNPVTREANDILDEISDALGVDVRTAASSPNRTTTPVRDATLARLYPEVGVPGSEPISEPLQPMSAEEVIQVQREQDQAARMREIEEVMQELFIVRPGDDGQPRYFVYDEGLQALQEVDTDTAMRTAQLVVDRRRQAEFPQLAEVTPEDVSLVEAEMLRRQADQSLPDLPAVDVEELTEIDLGATPLPEQEVAGLPEVEIIGEVREPTETVLETIERVTGLRRGEKLSRRDLIQAEDAIRDSLFVQDIDPDTGETRYLRYDPDLQRRVVVPQEEVDAAVKEGLRRLQEKPAKSWKEFVVKNFGMKPSQLTGRVWKQFADAANESGIKPEDPEALSFLEAQAAILASDPNTKSRFAAELGSRYLPQQPDAEADPAAATQVDDVEAIETTPQEAELIEQAATEAEAAQEAEAIVALAPEPDPAVPDVEVVRAERAIAKKARGIRGPERFARPNAIRRLLNEARGAGELDDTFHAIKQTETWRGLDEDVKNDITEHYSDLYDELEEAGRFSRVSEKPTTPMDKAEFDAMVAEAQANKPENGADIVGFDTVDEYRQATGNKAPDDMAGAYYEGIAYVVRENTPDASALAANILHEHGHRGLEGLLGDRLTAVTNRMRANAKLRRRINAKREQYRDENGVKLDWSTAGEEVLVDMIVGNERLAPSIMAKIRSAIDSSALRLLGVRDLSVSDTDVDRLLRNTASWLRGLPLDERSTVEDDQMMARLDDLLGDPRRAESSPRYSRNLHGLETSYREAVTSTKRSRAVEGYIRGSVDNTKHLIGNSTNKILKASLKATPLSQIVNLHGRMWDRDDGTNPFVEYNKQVRSTEAAFNQGTTRKRHVQYRDGSKYHISPRELADKWYKLKTDNPQQGGLIDVVQQYGTLYHLWPDLAWKDQHQNIDYERLGFDEAERKKALVTIRDAWKRMTPEARTIYKQSQALYQNMTETMYNELASELERSSGLERGTTAFEERYNLRMQSEIEALRTGPYSPLRRFGDYVVTIRDETGTVVEFQAFENKHEAKAFHTDMVDRLTEQGKTDWSVSPVMEKAEFISRMDGINHAAIQQLESRAANAVSQLDLDESDADYIRNNLKVALAELYLKSQPDTSILSHANRRKGIAGINMDSLRAFSDYAIKTAHRTANLRHGGNASRALLQMKQMIVDESKRPISDPSKKDLSKMGAVLSAVRSQREAALRSESNPLADKLSSASFFWFMTSLSQMFVNGMQTVMVAFPRLAANYRNFGVTSAKEIAEGMATFVRGGDMLKEGSSAPPGVRAVLQRLHDDGTLDFTLAHDLSAVARGDFDAMTPHWRAITKVMTWAMHTSEVFNRQVTAYAALKLEARKRNIDLNNPIDDETATQLAEVAAKFVNDTHFTYSRSDKAEIMQGPWRRLVFQFQHYRLNMLAMLAKDIRDSFTGTPEEKASARRALSWLIGTQAAMTGATGTVMAPIAFFIADMFRDDDDLMSSEAELVQFLPQWASHGILSGVIDPSRLSAGSLLPFFGDRDFAPEGSARDKFQYHLVHNAGPWAGLLTDFATGVEKVFEGELYEAAKHLLPKPGQDILEAFDDIDGVRDSRKVVYHETNLWDFATRAVGLRSGRRLEAENRRAAGYEMSERRAKLRSRALGKIAAGALLNDGALQQEGFEAVRRWNEANPNDPISRESIRNAIRRSVRDQERATRTGITANLPPSLLQGL